MYRRHTLFQVIFLLLVSMFSAPSFAALSDHFVTTWKTDTPGTSNATSITVPMIGGPYDVDWDNDGTFDEFGLIGSVTHDYGVSGTYTIRIQGAYDSIRFSNGGDYWKIISLDQWGTNSWSTMAEAFWGAFYLEIPATDTPNFSAVTNLSRMFDSARSANPDTSGWDTSAVTDMSLMFRVATSANPDTSSWDTSAVTNMVGMFTFATSANPDTSNWDTSAVTNMGFMFSDATSANPDTSSWDTSAVTNMSQMFDDAISAIPDTSSWDTSSVTLMNEMFQNATSANPDSSSWDVSAVTKMRFMFSNATLANPDVSGWDTSAVTEMQFMFASAKSFNQNIGSWNVTSISPAVVGVGVIGMFNQVALSTVNYDSLLVGWNTQAVQTGMTFSGGNSVYCSSAAIVARTNLISSHGWIITDGGQGCPSAPATPVAAPDLTAATDTGISDSDNITANNSPQLEVICSAINNSITLYTDKPMVNTAIGIHVCTSVGPEIATVTAVLIDGVHNITYIEQYIGELSSHSPSLAVTIDTIAPTGPGSLTAPGSPINDVNADIIGSCGNDTADGTVVVTTFPANGFNALYNSLITLDASGGFSIVDPNWSEGTFTVTLECSDITGNSATLGPFGPILIDLSCSGVDTVVTGNFPAGMYLCVGTNTLVTSGVVNLDVGAVMYFQSPEITLNNGFNVSEGASLFSSSVVAPVAPLLLGPTQVKASVGEILNFSETHICEDYEDGVLAITPFDTGVLVESGEPEIFTLSCTDFSGVTTQKRVTVIKE